MEWGDVDMVPIDGYRRRGSNDVPTSRGGIDNVSMYALDRMYRRSSRRRTTKLQRNYLTDR